MIVEESGKPRLFPVLVASLIIGMLALPVMAKGPWRVTVKGPEIEGEVDILEEGRPPGGFAFWFPNDFLAESLASTPVGDLGGAYIVTWYSVLGAPNWRDRPSPMIDRVAYYPDVDAVQMLEASGGLSSGSGSRWYRVDPTASAAFSEALERIRERGLTGAAGYTFVTEGAGRGAKADWVAEPLAESHGAGNSVGTLLTVATALVAALGVLLGLGKHRRTRTARRDGGVLLSMAGLRYLLNLRRSS